MKIYEADGCGGLVDVTANRKGLCGYTSMKNGVYIADHMEMHVLVKSEHGAWLTTDLRRVDLYNVLGTGVLRWHEPMGSHEDGFRRLSPAALKAAQFFELTPAGMVQERWEEIQEGYLIKLEDLEELEVSLLREASGSRAKILMEERIREGDEWKTTVRAPREGSLIYDLQAKGLVILDGSSSGCGFGKNANRWNHVQWYRLTQKGRRILEKGIA